MQKSDSAFHEITLVLGYLKTPKKGMNSHVMGLAVCAKSFFPFPGL